jgi:hypothetical protein
MPNLGIRLQLLLGAERLVPAPYEVAEALRQLEVQNNDGDRDGFQLTFSLGRRGVTQDYPLLRDGQLDPPARLTIVLIIQALPTVLINGIITHHEVVPNTKPGQSQLRIKGEDTGLLMDLQRKKVTFSKQSDQSIVNQILSLYQKDLLAETSVTQEVPSEEERITSQQDTDLGFIKKLAERNGFRFYTEPTAFPGVSTAYWGPRDRTGQSGQRPLTTNMGPADNVKQLSFEYDALAAVTPEASTSDPVSKKSIPVSVPGMLEGQLSSQPAKPLRTVALDNTAGLNPIQAGLRMRNAVAGGGDAARGSGQLDTVRYGAILRSRQKVKVRGAGDNQNGEYYVSQVTHNIQPGQCTQNFQLIRDGRGTTSTRVETGE